MSAPLFALAPPFGNEVLRTWLLPLGDPVAAERKPGDPLPQRVINRITGPADRFTDRGRYSLHDFAASYTAAEDLARETIRRVLLLKPPPQRPITLTGGRVVYVDGLVVEEWPHPEHYSDTVKRFVSTIRVDLRFVPA